MHQGSRKTGKAHFWPKTHFFHFVLGCVDAEFCDQIRVGKLLTRSTNYLRVNTFTLVRVNRLRVKSHLRSTSYAYYAYASRLLTRSWLLCQAPTPGRAGAQASARSGSRSARGRRGAPRGPWTPGRPPKLRIRSPGAVEVWRNAEATFFHVTLTLDDV